MSDTPPVNSDAKLPAGPMLKFRTKAENSPWRKGQVIDSIEEKDDILLRFRLDDGEDYFIVQSQIVEWKAL